MKSSKTEQDQIKEVTNMKTYFIRTFATEDQPEMICGYAYDQFLEVIRSLKARGIEYATWTE